MPARPDIVLLLTDQERFPPAYTTPDERAWRAAHLPARRWFRQHGTSFTRHYVGSVACVPSRATLFTGHYPPVHGVDQTTGLAKHADGPRVRWLEPDGVPTLGHWLRASGYDTAYKGKWHVSDADLRTEDGAVVETHDMQSRPIAEGVAAYLDADPLGPFGFEGWVGPEPHGARAVNSGLVRDPVTAQQAVSWLRERYRQREAGDAAAQRPFLLVVCFVNPHDIVFWPLWSRRSPLGQAASEVPTSPSPTDDDTLADRPPLQAAYREAYPAAYGPPGVIAQRYTDHAHRYRQTYLRLHQRVDAHLERVRRAATSGGRAPVMVASSDHGDFMGSHGGLHQKWGALYDEAVRVPLCIVGGGFEAGAVVDTPTSHVDLLPTLLGVAGADPAALGPDLPHREVHDLPGRDLAAPLPRERSVYLCSNDAILEGEDQLAAAARRAPLLPHLLRLDYAAPLGVATSMEALVSRAPEALGGHLFKLVRTWDDPDTWSEPGGRHVALGRDGERLERERPLPDAWELYDLSDDPAERRNLARPASAVRAHFEAALADARRQRVPSPHTPRPRAPYHPTRPPRRGVSLGPAAVSFVRWLDRVTRD